MPNQYRIKSWLEAVPNDKDSSTLMSEVTNYTLEGELLSALPPLLDGSRDEDEICNALSDRFSLAEIYYAFNQLKEKGLIEPVSEKKPSPREILLDRLGGNTVKLGSIQAISITTIGKIDPLPLAERLSRLDFCQVQTIEWSSGSSGSDSLWIVLTPDYLEPELKDFNAWALKEGVRWLPFKPDGIQSWMGPLVIPGETACLECLLHRLRGHRGLEMKLIQERGATLYLSKGRSAASMDTACGLLGLELEKMIFDCPHAGIRKGVVTINFHDLENRFHELVKRPHCPACGHSIAPEIKELPDTDLKLSSRPKADWKDGGERIKVAAETLKLFKTRISPLSGEVGLLESRENMPDFFGYSIVSSWASLNNCKIKAGQGRMYPTGVSAGKGRSEIQARASALGEALERYCTQHFGYEPFFRAAYSDIANRAIHPLELNPFSPSQYEHREDWAKRADTGHVPKPYDENTPIDWTPGWSLTYSRWKFIPAAYMYYAYSVEGGGEFAWGDSNGVAAGNCLEEAIMQGFFELVERDGVGLWWYNKLRRPSLALPSFNDAFAMGAFEGLRRRGYNMQILDLTTDLGIPVFAAVALNESDSNAEPLLGFGSHFDPKIALDRAVSELGQSWNIGGKLSPNEINRKVTGRNLSAESFLRPLEDSQPISFESFNHFSSNDLLSDINHCVSLLKGLGLEMLVADLTRPEVGLAVARVMVPGLSHFWPRLATHRLYEVPVKLRWLDSPKNEAELNPVPFFF